MTKINVNSQQIPSPPPNLPQIKPETGEVQALPTARQSQEVKQTDARVGKTATKELHSEAKVLEAKDRDYSEKIPGKADTIKTESTSSGYGLAVSREATAPKSTPVKTVDYEQTPAYKQARLQAILNIAVGSQAEGVNLFPEDARHGQIVQLGGRLALANAYAIVDEGMDEHTYVVMGDKPIGTGAFKQVYAVLAGTGPLFDNLGDMVLIKAETKNAAADLNREFAGSRLKLPHVVTTLAAHQWVTGEENDQVTHLVMVQESMKGGDVEKLVTSANVSMDIKVETMRQFAMGIAELHANNIVHRDIKPANAMFKEPVDKPNSQPSDVKVKVIDFGTHLDMRKSADNPKDALTWSGTLGYAAPEQVALQSYAKFDEKEFAENVAACRQNQNPKIREQKIAQLEQLRNVALGKMETISGGTIGQEGLRKAILGWRTALSRVCAPRTADSITPAALCPVWQIVSTRRSPRGPSLAPATEDAMFRADIAQFRNSCRPEGWGSRRTFAPLWYLCHSPPNLPLNTVSPCSLASGELGKDSPISYHRQPSALAPTIACQKSR